MPVGTFIWVDFAAAALLAGWLAVRSPGFGPKTLRWSSTAFIAAQVLARLALFILVPMVRLPHGVQLVLVLVVFPAFLIMLLSSLWLLRAIVAAVGGPRGGHFVRSPLGKASA
jgi:hypothetical protein